MAYSKEATISEMLSYYEFLVRLCLPSSSLVIPPAGGWSNITPERFKALRKNDIAVDLLKHIPYISEDEGSGRDEHEIAPQCVCNDYRGKQGQELIVDNQDPEYYADAGELTANYEEHAWIYDPHVVTLGRAKEGDIGFWMFCNTANGEMSLVDPIWGRTLTSPDAATFFAGLKEDLISLRVAPVPSGDDMQLRRARSDPFREIEETAQVKIIRKHGWPSGDYQKEKCLDELCVFEDSR